MSQITLKQLAYFDQLSRHGHFGRAASACAISQPALSVQIRELEATLGATLFERGARQVRLTAFGESFALRVREILRAVDELADLARAAQENMTGRFRIGVIPTVAPYLLPGFVRALADLHPSVELEIRETLTERLIGELLEGRLDTAIVALPVSEPSLTEMALFSEPFLLVRPQAEADLPVPDREDLPTMRLLLLEEGHCFRDQALSFCNMRPALPRGGLDGSSLHTLVQMVGAGLGVTFLPQMAVAVETRAAPVAAAAFAGPQPQRTIGMIWRRTNPLAAQFERIGVVLKEVAEGVLAGQDPSARIGSPASPRLVTRPTAEVPVAEVPIAEAPVAEVPVAGPET